MVFITVSAYLQLFLALLAKGSERELAAQLWEPGGAAVDVTPVTHPRSGWPDSDDHQGQLGAVPDTLELQWNW